MNNKIFTNHINKIYYFLGSTNLLIMINELFDYITSISIFILTRMYEIYDD